MVNQSIKAHYTLEEIERIGKRWLNPVVFGGFIATFLQSELERTGKKKRFYDRLLPPLVTFWLMVFQRLNADHSCDAAMSSFIGQQAPERVLDISESNSAYCQARQRLPWPVLQASLKHTAQCLREELGEAALWCGRQVALLDGSTMRLAATDELHDHYGVSSNQHGENHWPIMRILAAFHLFSGGVEGIIEAPFHVGESTMTVQLLRTMGAGWVWVGDMNFGSYRTAQVAKDRQQDVVLRIRPDWAKRWIGEKKMHSEEDRAVIWSGKNNSHVQTDIPRPEIDGRLIYLRIEHNGFRPIDLYLFTTLTDPIRYSTWDILDLYGLRWNVELNFRHLKTTMQMEELTGKSVDIVRKELWVGLLAYTLIRGLMGLAAVRADLTPLGLSFVRCLRRILDVAQLLACATSPQQFQHEWERLLARLAKCKLPQRKKRRFEPRRVWGKPRVYRSIKGSRDQARAEELAQRANTNS